MCSLPHCLEVKGPNVIFVLPGDYKVKKKKKKKKKRIFFFFFLQFTKTVFILVYNFRQNLGQWLIITLQEKEKTNNINLWSKFCQQSLID